MMAGFGGGRGGGVAGGGGGGGGRSGGKKSSGSHVYENMVSLPVSSRVEVRTAVHCSGH